MVPHEVPAEGPRLNITITCWRDETSDEADRLNPYVAMSSYPEITMRRPYPETALRDVQGAVLHCLGDWSKPPKQISFTFVTLPEKEESP